MGTSERRAGRGRRAALALAVAAALGAPATGAGQDLADYDYENLSFRGIGLEAGFLAPNRVESTTSIGVRADLGFLGPNVRVSPSISLWRSSLKNSEVAELERRLEELVDLQDPDAQADVDLGDIDWSDVMLGMDIQYLWEPRGTLVPFVGAGAAAHLMNGKGAAIEDTFVEDLLDRITAGFNVHGGAELSLTPSFVIMGMVRFELMDDLRYGEIRFGGQVRVGGGGS